jgi:cytochrome c oxidase assembly protein subunit 15
MLLFVQVALGGWVSTNYAVLACSGFPACNGQWWPDMAFAEGFTLLRHLGRDADGGLLTFPALVAIHVVHRAFAVVVTAALGVLAWRLWRAGQARAALVLAALLGAQVASGLSNVVLGWPLAAALVHTAGAAALAGWMARLLAHSATVPAARSRDEPPQRALA